MIADSKRIIYVTVIVAALVSVALALEHRKPVGREVGPCVHVAVRVYQNTQYITCTPPTGTAVAKAAS